MCHLRRRASTDVGGRRTSADVDRRRQNVTYAERGNASKWDSQMKVAWPSAGCFAQTQYSSFFQMSKDVQHRPTSVGRFLDIPRRSVGRPTDVRRRTSDGHPTDVRRTSGRRLTDVRTSDGRPTDVRRMSDGRPSHGPTGRTSDEQRVGRNEGTNGGKQIGNASKWEFQGRGEEQRLWNDVYHFFHGRTAGAPTPPDPPPLLPPSAIRTAKFLVKIVFGRKKFPRPAKKFFCRKFVWPTKFLVEKVFDPKICSVEFVFGRKQISVKKLFRPKTSKKNSFEKFAVRIAEGGSNGGTYCYPTGRAPSLDSSALSSAPNSTAIPRAELQA